MRSLGADVWTFADGSDEMERWSVNRIRSEAGHVVRGYRELVKCVANLSYRNPEYVLMFRGQDQDYANRNEKTVLYPEIFRQEDVQSNLTHVVLYGRFKRLAMAERLLRQEYGSSGDIRVRRYQIVRWAIIQHYRICSTPLLDVTSSLRVALSFALRSSENGFVYAIAIPQISGSVTASSEYGIQTIRLSSLCPPSALRPHYQDAFLVGEYPTISSVDEKQEYERSEVDFSRRLIAKFVVERKNFQDRLFPLIREEALFPDEGDPLKRIAERIQVKLDQHMPMNIP